MKKARIFFLVVVITYLAIGIVLYFVQDLLIFDPKTLPKDHKFSFNESYEELNLSIDGRNLNIVKFRPEQSRKGIILFFHGKTANVEHYKKYPSLFLKNGYEIWMMDYPGFGKSTGKPTEKIIYEDALVMYQFASREVSGDSIIIYGKSLGTGIASFVAANRNCRQLILEAPYYSLTSLARHYVPVYPTGLLVKYSFPVHEYLPKVKAPVTIFHGTDDGLIPYKHSKWLKEENNKINLVTIDKGTHNDLGDFALFRSTLDSLLSY